MGSSQKSKFNNYPKPGETGGMLIREVISFYREQQRLDATILHLPLVSHILVAVSGGIDSMALATLMIKYGRRVGGRIRIVHINHRWRAEESDQDERFVRDFAKRHSVPITIVRLKKYGESQQSSSESLEAQARAARKRIFDRLSEKYQAPVFTAHHADDFAETLIWRLFTGTSNTHGGGISFRHGCEIRPFLRIRKSMLKKFLDEENQGWREDRTNHEGRFLRSKLRVEVMPLLEKIFPRMVQRLLEQGLRAQSQVKVDTQIEIHSLAETSKAKKFDTASKENSGKLSSQNFGSTDSVDLTILFSAAGLAVRKTHYEALQQIQKRVNSHENQLGSINLPGGWRLGWLTSSSGRQKWILEQS